MGPQSRLLLLLLLLLLGLTAWHLQHHSTLLQMMHAELAWHRAKAHAPPHRSLRAAAGYVVPARLRPGDYPVLSPLPALLRTWPVNVVKVPASHEETALRRIDMSAPGGGAEALRMRRLELPFVLTGVRNVAEVAAKWTGEYLTEHMGGDAPRSVELSESNLFVYYHGGRGPPGWTPPQKRETMSFRRWWAMAASVNASAVAAGGRIAAATPHWYMSISASEQASPSSGLGWVTRDLKIFSRADRQHPWEHEGFRFVLDPSTNKGTHCRFGMAGIVAAAHYDGKRNMVAMLKGAKRYVLAPPSSCAHIDLLPRGHPSARHTRLDWRADPDANIAKHPEFAHARGLQTVVRAGEVLYIPSYWMHMPVSLDTSVQCNTRSGNAQEGRDAIAKCGFYNEVRQ